MILWSSVVTFKNNLWKTEMTDMIFSTDGEEKFRIPSPFSHNYYVVTKCPTHKLEIKERKMTDFDNDKLNENVQNYFSILIESLCARIEGNEEREDSLLDYLDKIWNNLTPEEIGIINKIIKEFKND